MKSLIYFPIIYFIIIIVINIIISIYNKKYNKTYEYHRDSGLYFSLTMGCEILPSLNISRMNGTKKGIWLDFKWLFFTLYISFYVEELE